jgi:hypothetical protein
VFSFQPVLPPAPALIASVLWILVFLQYRESFQGIFTARAATQA